MNISEVIKIATDVINEGGIILYPTDTIWGIGGDATNSDVIERIYKLKNRSDSKSLVSLVADLEMLESLTTVSKKVKSVLADSKKPTTIIYSNVTGIDQKALAKDGSAAIRVPENDFCKQLIRKLNKPLISTSANLSGEDSPTGFSNISDKVKSAVDFIVPQSLENKTNEKASRILKLEGEDVIVIRE